MKKVFIDTGAFLAKEIARDQHHAEAIESWKRLAEAPEMLYTSEHCLDETATLLARRTNYAFASHWGADLLSSGISILQTGSDDWKGAFQMMRKFADQGVSFTDCLSFHLMKRHRIRSVFGFDQHFISAGFQFWKSG